MELLERAITVIKKHLADKTAYEWTACHISSEMKSIIRDYESIPIEPPVMLKIAEDFKMLKEIVEGELLAYDIFPPKDDVQKIHKEACEEALRKVKSYFS